MGDSKYTPNPRKYYKTNFVDLVELITPEVYKTEDLSLSGTEVNPLSQVINSHLNVAARISNVIPLSGVANSQTSALGNISGISQYFVKQNELTKINPFLFESKILLPLSTTFANYDTSAEFATYLSGTLLPMIIPPSLTQVDPLQANMTTLSALTGDVNASSVHNHLVDTLGWMYFLNTSADGGLDYSPSSYVLSSLNSLYLGNTLETIDGIKGLTEYLWRNNETCSFGSYIPTDFVSGTADGITESSAGVIPTYTSGTQKLEALQTLVDVIYSPLYIDQQDYTVKSAFDNFIDASLSLTDRTAKGPFRKFTNLLGYEFADLTNEIDNIGLIYDIENVKDEHIQYIADLIGFRLRGNSPSKWRQQLRLALDLYKKSGTIDAIQAAINALIVDSVFDVSGKVDELWESYIPQLIWYALGTESPLFKDLNTWTFDLANQAGIYAYSTSSLDENLKIVTDSILLDLYKAFPDNFLFHGNKFSVPELWELDANGCTTKRYTVVNEPGMKPFHVHSVDSLGYQAYKQEAKQFDESKAFEAATGFGALGSGVYMAGADHPTTGERPTYLKPQGDLNFLFSYREKENYPLPPFEEVKYYRDSTVTADLVSLLVARLKCFKVKESFADEVGNYILSSAVTDDSDLGTLNEFLMLFSSVQVPSNFDDVMLSISDYEKNLLDLWNGKSSHLFINFKDTDFDFAKTTLEGDGKYALYEAARVAREFSPAHAITRVNLTASAEDALSTSSAKWEYLGFDKDDNRASYTSASVLGNFEISGAAMGLVAPGNSDGRGGLNTFKRADVDRITDALESTTAANITAPRRALRRRNFRYTLPKEGYYDRTGFNSPVNWDLEAQNPNLVSYSVAPTNDPGIFPDPTDVQGDYWIRTNPDLGTVSSVLLTNPDGGVSSITMSGGNNTDSHSLGLIQLNPRAALYGNNADNSRMPLVETGKTITWSTYVKRAPTPTLATSSCSIHFTGFDEPGTGQVGKGYAHFAWASDDPSTSSVLTLIDSDAGYPVTLEDAGDGWYRISVSVSGNPWGSHMEASGLWSIVSIGSTKNSDANGNNVRYKSMYWYGPQVEQWNTDLNKTVPTPYQPVSGASPDISTYNTRGELTLGYVPSAGEFYPILDPINPSGVWHECEKLDSSRQFSGVYTSATYPYRGLSSLGSNNKMPEVGSTTDRYVDRGQVPELYNTMHELLESKAYDYANEQINLTSSSYAADAYWKNNRQSFANEAIASGFVLNSFADYENFSFGTGLQKAHRDYCKYFAKHPLGLNELYNTGGNIFAQVFGKGLYNCDFDIAGSAAVTPLLGIGNTFINPGSAQNQKVTTFGQSYISSSTTGALPISSPGVFSTYLADSTGNYMPDSTYMASGNNSNWEVGSDGSSTVNSHVAPDGSKTGCTIVGLNGGLTTQNLKGDTGIFPDSPAGTELNFSFFFKNATELNELNGSGVQIIYYLDRDSISGSPADQMENVSFQLRVGAPGEPPRVTSLTNSKTSGRINYTLDQIVIEDAGNDWYRISMPMRNWNGRCNTARMRFYPLPVNLGSGDASATFWGAQVASGTAQTPFNGLGTYIASGLEESVIPLTGTFTPPFSMASGSYTAATPFNAEFRNPNILSGVEFVQTSGAPTTNQFAVFKLDSSKAVPGEENSLINNSVIKCKSVGGLPRLRFDLSSYGDRPNHFIKDHKFKLNVKALVAEENSPIFGGGQLGVWIHTKPISRRNPNLLSYTPETYDGAEGNSYWGTNSQLGTVSSVEVTNPFGGASSLIFSGAEDATSEYALIVALSSGPLMPVWHSEKTLEASWYVKKPDSNAASGFMIDIINTDATSTSYDDHTVQWYWDGTTPVFRSRPFTNVSHREESVGDDWWRISMAVSGLASTSEQSNGDALQLAYMIGDTAYDVPNYIRDKTIYFWAPQLEQYPVGMKDSNYLPDSLQSFPAAYQAVSGAEPVYGNEVSGFMWSWTPNGKWEVTKESELSIPRVKNVLTHLYDFPVKTYPTEEEFCLGNTSDSSEVLNNNTLLNIKDSYFENFEIEFDTRNFTIHNNSEYLDIIPMENDVYEVTPQVNRDDTNYIVEVFFVPNNNPDKYLLIDSIELQDVTQRENTGIGTGHGVDTSGIPLRPFVTEDKLYLDKDQLRDVLKFYNGLAGLGTGMYATNLASRDATITSGTLELSGGSRLNYRLSPTWGATNANNQQPNYNSFSSLEIDN
jgi:hypothetical protein